MNGGPSLLDNPTTREWIVAQVRAGRSERDIAGEIGTSRTTIQRAKVRYPDFREAVEVARLTTAGEQRAVEQMDRVRARASRSAAKAKPAPAADRDVVEAELVVDKPPPRPGCCPACGYKLDLLALLGDEPGDRGEFLRHLWAAIRERDGRALDIGAKYYLGGEILRERLEVQRLLERSGMGGARVVVLQLPHEAPSEGS